MVVGVMMPLLMGSSEGLGHSSRGWGIRCLQTRRAGIGMRMGLNCFGRKRGRRDMYSFWIGFWRSGTGRADRLRSVKSARYIYLSSSGISLCFSGAVHFDSFVAHRVFIHRSYDLDIGSERAMGLFLVRFWNLARRHAYNQRRGVFFCKRRRRGEIEGI
jgi:hypothetical protein